MKYDEFLKSKVRMAQTFGHEVPVGAISDRLKPHQRSIVEWLVRGGRRACFAAFGLGKSVIQLETIRLMIEQHGGRGLIVCPLGVRAEFIRDAERILGWTTPPRFIRRIEEVDATGIYITNYETIREGKLDPAEFTAASLDEASILRGFGGTKTFREVMRLFTGDGGPTRNHRTDGKTVQYRFVATATPSPNDYIEMLAYSEFLGIMDISQAKTRFFKRDSTHADRLTIHPHKEREFWLWVSSWALFVQRPSDLGFIDDGYAMPPMTVHWHEVKTDHKNAGYERCGQAKMFRDASIGIQDSSAEKRNSLPVRLNKVIELLYEQRDEERQVSRLVPQESRRVTCETEREKRQELFSESSEVQGAQPRMESLGLSEQVVLWCDLNDEQKALEGALKSIGVTFSSLTGTQPLEEREALMQQWKGRESLAFISKPTMYGAGVNLQQCHRMIFFGIGFKFYEVIQSVHRVHRFLQDVPCHIHFIYTEAERGIRKQLERKWSQHNNMVKQMTAIIKEFGLSASAMSNSLTRGLGVERVEVNGEGYHIVNNDCVEETKRMASDSVGLVLTSIPFSTQYEYSPNYADFGHSEGNEEFFDQMDFLTPELLRVLKPGRIAAIHVKDRIVPGGMTGLGFQIVYPFHAKCIEHYTKHGFGYMGMKTIVTDVVRENAQTYRLGWTEQCKDGSKMGVGMPEYLLLFRKPTSDTSNSYADEPVVKSKDRYTRTRWQIDAHGFARSSGNRLFSQEELKELPHNMIFQMFKKHSLETIYDFEHHVRVGEQLEEAERLPVTFMLLQPQSWSNEVWSDITRMLSLNSAQSAAGREMHLCPMQFDIADRVIEQMSNKGDVVFDPFAGIGSVPSRAILQGRIGWGTELSASYFCDAVHYCKMAAEKMATPDLFSTLEPESENDCIDLPKMTFREAVAVAKEKFQEPI